MPQNRFTVALSLSDMTMAEEKLSSYINEHLNELSGITSVQLAEKAGVSQSTVIKFSQKLGYPGFKRMIQDITSDQPADNLNEELESGESTASTAAKLIQVRRKAVEMTYGLNPDAEIEKAARIIHSSGTVYIYAYNARESYFAHYFATELCRIGLPAITAESITEEAIQLSLISEGDVVVILSKSGETREMLNLAKIARKHNASVISLTRTQKNALAKISDVNLKTVEYRTRTVMRERAVTESFLFLIDLITLSVIKLRPEEAEKQILNVRLITKPTYVEP